ncbi:hypothetical protein [Ferruginibacter sp.]
MNNDEIFNNALNRCLEYTQAAAPADTIFIELDDTLNFNLPANIRGSVIAVLPFDSLIVRLRSKPDPHYYTLMQWSKDKEVNIVLFEVPVKYAEDEVVSETGPDLYRVTYLESKDKLLSFKKIEKGSNGCRHLHKIRNGRFHSYESICT